MTTVHSFAPIEPKEAHILILGSMPGKASLRAGQYYAHPRNAFWPIVAELAGIDADRPYDERVSALRATGIGVWDVLQACTRTSSLDSDIVESSIVINDFAGWFERHPGTRAVFCNGGKAYESFQKRVIPTLPEPFNQRPVHKLPSTSPAHAAMRPAEKAKHWAEALRPYLSQRP